MMIGKSGERQIAKPRNTKSVRSYAYSRPGRSPQTRPNRSPATSAGTTIGLLILLLDIVDDDALEGGHALGQPGRGENRNT